MPLPPVLPTPTPTLLVELLLPPVAKVGTVELVFVAVVFTAKAWP
jgi:hypothetical protein